MKHEKMTEIHSDFQRALQRLNEAVKKNFSKGSIGVDGVIQRFEFTFELAWKSAQAFLKYQGIEANSPRSVIKEAAFKTRIIQDGADWIDILEDRNKTSHLYDEGEALKIYKKIKGHHIFLLNALEKSVSDLLSKT